MAAVVASRSGSLTQTKKATLPLVQTNGNTPKPGHAPSSSPSSATKRLPGQPQSAQPAPPTPTTANATARANRRPQRNQISTRLANGDPTANDKRRSLKFPEPYVSKESHILQKFKGRPPSLIVHLHPTNFRFDQQDGSFSYHSEMRIFIEHLSKQTIPHDMLEEFRDAGVTFYDGWLIVKVIDHRSVSKTIAASSNGTDDETPFSIHNYNPHITPSPYAPYPTKQQAGEKSSPSKQVKDEDGAISAKTSDATEANPKPEPKVYHVGLRPTLMSRHIDLTLDALAPDPKSLNRKQSQANVRSGGVPQTPTTGIPSTPLLEKGPPPKKMKMKIDAKDLLEYEARVINATAPPLYLEPVSDAIEAQAVLEMLTDPFHDIAAPSPKGRKRTIAELAADDAHAKQQEQFMLVMDERNAGVNNANAADGQATNVIFQPRFEKFNALETIKRDMAEKKQQEKDRQLQEDENRRDTQQRLAEEERRKVAMRAREQQQARLRQQQAEAHQLALQQQAAHQQAQQQQQAARQQQQQAAQQAAQQAHASGIPPNVQNQVMGNQQRSSPVIRQGTPNVASSPVVNQGPGGAGSPPRPGSALQHSHPMARGPSSQSRHGTPQIPNATPGMRTATPVLRQGTPAQHMTQASPHNSMMAPTPQMAQAQAAMAGQMQNGMTPQQLEMQRRQAAMRAQQMQAQQAAMMAGNPQMVHNMATQNAMQQQQAAMQRQQHMQNQMGHSPAQQTQGNYNRQLSEQMKAQLQNLQGSQGSPVQHQMTPQQQQAAMMHQQQQQQQRMMQQGQMMGNMQNNMQPGQNRPANAAQQYYQNAVMRYQRSLTASVAQKYGGMQNVPSTEMQKISAMAANAARQELENRQSKVNAMRQQQAQQQQHGMVNGMNMMNPNMAAMQQQQQQAQQMQGMHMAHAQQQMLAQQQAQQQGQQNMYAQMQMQQQQQQRQG